MSNAIVTGARGFIGRYLSRELSSSGWRVCGIGHGSWPESEATQWGVSRWLPGEIDSHNLRLLQIETGSPEVIFHLAGGASVFAAIQNPNEDFRKTVATTVELLEWVRVHSPTTRVVVVSSAAVYGVGHEGQISESARCKPFSPYGFHKKMMEDLCASYAASYGVSSIIGRLFSVYGPGLKKQLLWDLCSRLAAGDREITLGGTGNEVRDWTDVRDVVRALPYLTEYAGVSASVINVGTGIAASVSEVAGHVVEAWGRKTNSSGIVFRHSGVARVGDPFSLLADPTALAGLGFSWRTDWRCGIADYVEWFLNRRDT